MRFGILQYVPIKLFCAIVTFATQLSGKYTGKGHFTADVAYPYIAVIANCSQIWAMYCLVLFYNVLKDDLAPIKPLAKFISVKAVVFFTFWQSVFISVLVDINWLHATTELSTDEISTGLQDLIICFEMVVAAVVHLFIFPPKEFHDPDNLERHGVGVRLHTFLNPKDLILDVNKHFIVQVGKDVKKQGKKVIPGKKRTRKHPVTGVPDPIELGIASDAFDMNDSSKQDSDSDSETEPVDAQVESPTAPVQAAELAPPDETISSGLFFTPTEEVDEIQQDRPLIF